MPGPDARKPTVETPHETTPAPPAAPGTETGASPAVSPRLVVANRYEVLDEAGSGGMGVVYRAHDRETGEMLALKVLKPEVASDHKVLERFRNELRLARRVTHSNVCRIYDLGRSGDLTYITMEYVEGQSLRNLLSSRGVLQVAEGLPIARQICQGLREAHREGIVHRDLKPENIMLDRSGAVKIMDFGLARSLMAASTLTVALVGTPAYMSPEQAAGRRVDCRSDIYALGLILYEMFTGVAAFTADTPVALAMKQIYDTPVRPRELEPQLPVKLEKTILRCLEKDLAGRFQTVDELESALREEPAATTGDLAASSRRTPWYETPKSELPAVRRATVRLLLGLVQVMYLVFYLLALAKLDFVHQLLAEYARGGHRALFAAVVGTALIGVATRLYLLSAIALDYLGLAANFRRIFLLLLLLDELWALSPLLVARSIGPGLALAACAALIYLPFSQRTLVRMAYET